VYNRGLGDESLWRLEELEHGLRVVVDEVDGFCCVEPLELGEHQEAEFQGLRLRGHGCWLFVVMC